MKDATAEAFGDFLKKIGMKTIDEYEQSRENEHSRVINEKKN